MHRKWKKFHSSPLVLVYALLFLTMGAASDARARQVMDDLSFFASITDRSTGSPGSEEAADYILKSFEEAGLSNVGVQKFLTPIAEVVSASLEVSGEKVQVYPWGPNMAYLPRTQEEGLRGPLVYVGEGNLNDLNGKEIKGSIVLMDMASYGNWINASMLGAHALIYLGEENANAGEYREKNTPTPIAFPRYWVSHETAEKLKALAIEKKVEAVVKSEARWENKMVRNCYGFVPGKDPKLSKELIVLDAFYDASSPILGLAPGADEATSIAVLLTLAQHLAQNPPDRTVLFLATTGNGQSLAGMRQFIWSVTTRKKLLRKDSKQLQTKKKEVDQQLDILRRSDPFSVQELQEQELLWNLTLEKARDKADALTREVQYRKMLSQEDVQEDIEAARAYRRLSWLSEMSEMTSDQRILALQLVKEAVPDLKKYRKELKNRRDVLKSTIALRNIIDEYKPVFFLSLYLSSHSSTIGLVELGDTYPVRETVRRMMRAGRLVNLLNLLGSRVAENTGLPNIIRDTTRGGSPEGGFGKSSSINHPCCDVGALAGLPAVSLMTLDDYRTCWTTPQDTLDRVNKKNVEILSRFLAPLFQELLSYPGLHTMSEEGVRGLASLEGQAKFIRQGELFPDQPAPDTIISVLQGDSIFRAMVFQDGTFFIPGLANKRVSLEKLILEPYGLDPKTGRVAWTADKAQTGKINYRIKVKSDLASTSLVMFHCLQTDVVGVFNPRNLGYLTKVQLLDAATEATPLRYWYSRIDGRDTKAISLFLEKGTRFKLILSESLLSKDFFLLNSTEENPTGKGFLIGSPPILFFPPYQVARDLKLLLGERLENLFKHGITNRYLQTLYSTSVQQLEESKADLQNTSYGPLWQKVHSAWAKLDVVYGEIESTQRDVLTGVMFFIALFVPFAYCMERYLFCFRSIYQQIIAFFLILVMTIFIIRALHPAFYLTYSPMVVIIAFFIVGLSILVSWIIFMRFEQEMANQHSLMGGSHPATPQVSKWQAFGAGFSIGVSNLNRRKLRTGLTCITLIILTFTVMSFTNVKSIHTTTRTRIAPTDPYRGVLIRHQYRLPLTLLTLQDMQTSFDTEAAVWPKGWIEPSNSSDRTIARIQHLDANATVEGVLGVGHTPPKPFQDLVLYGRWFMPRETQALLMSLTIAEKLKLDPQKDLDIEISLFGDRFRVIGYFDGNQLEALKDLDQNPITPAYMERSQSEELSEVEIEAMQSGEEMLPQSERFRFANADTTIIIPFQDCIYYGGTLRTVTILPHSETSPTDIADQLSSWLTFPLFVGDNGAWFQSASNTVRYQGVTNLFVPILIVIFITLNTMIGHVHERQREISTYTSVGLAPTHVGFLFIVEALSLAVLSTVIGYILAQMSAKYLGNTALFSALTFNYSSLASVACMFLVFSVVFLAALYPARMAAEIAMPDVERSWSLPEPDGDTIVMNLPFLLKHEEEKGIIGFLHAFYIAHEDITHGVFAVDEVSLDEDAPVVRPGELPLPVCTMIRTNVWLAPFDFGIKQRIQLHCCPSTENPGYLEISIRMIRLSGEQSAWMRANKNFIKALRKQMLLWRLMDQEAKSAFSA
ncbi:FtsX-like permease family protein [Desulforhabdus amnigena]|jgi:hypothetical protein|uniref:FtsX-like permease family protein n=1 Tax=Desulforhabdus amnigena TaxID=40218 RepID=A0A9W6D0C9_9BACT|nr:FtsX-like permease family protein [Desulforhabdus amnigena]NLJ29041.1 M28 family peptidase [Deltaproteobacteria bacterium]GLI33697.1 hypothetical protein DAMNIGENAA_11300 [Desulforhabdus amnigena]